MTGQAERLGIILAGGTGSRLYPLTSMVNKQILPVYDKPLIYYSLSTLMLAGIRRVAIVSTPQWLPELQRCLGDGARLGIEIHYVVQPSPDGIAQAILLCAHLIDGPVALILGDNIFFRTGLGDMLRAAAEIREGATIFALPVARPERFGIVVLDEEGRPLRLVEKPKTFVGNHAVPGLYFYDADALELARTLRPSPRGELEITDLNRLYLERGRLRLEMLGRGCAWLDCGTPEDLFEAGQLVRVLEERTGIKIACPEEVALNMGFIDEAQFASLIEVMPACSYADYLRLVASERKRREGGAR
jgi:glucose-1-phosphate thymidylyltransferase